MSHDLLGTLAAWQREFGDVLHLRVWPEHLIVVADPELVRDLLLTQHATLIRWERAIHVFAELHGHSVLMAEGQTWAHKRQALQPRFTPKAVQAWVPTMADAAVQAFGQWPLNAPHWPIESALTSLTMDVIMRMLFSSAIGADARSAEQAVHTVSAAANAEFYWPVSWPASWPAWLPGHRSKRQALATLKSLVERHLQTRLQMAHDAWPDDLLSRLLQLHHEDAIAWPLQAVRDECMTTFLAGHETLAATLTWWAWCMAANPVAQTAARAEVQQQLQGRAPNANDLAALPYVVQTLKETLRLYPAVPLLFSRRATSPLNLGPWQVPARTLLMVPVQLLHHDPRHFPNPLAFQPERFAPDAAEFARGAYLPFGTGPRVCLGQHLAMAEMTLIAALLLQRCTLCVPQGMAAPEPVMQVTLRPRQPLHLQVMPASAAVPVHFLTPGTP